VAKAKIKAPPKPSRFDRLLKQEITAQGLYEMLIGHQYGWTHLMALDLLAQLEKELAS